MKILFVNNGLAGGGAEKLLNDMLPILKQKHECSLLLLSDKDEKYLDNLKLRGIEVTVLPDNCKCCISKIKFIKKYIQNGKFDIVHANCFPSFYYCAFSKMIAGKKFPKLIMTEHNTDNRRRHIRWIRPLEKLVYGVFDWVVSISESTQVALLKWLSPKETSKFLVIENGVPIDSFVNASPKERSDFIDKITEEDFLICMIGSFTEQKNHSFMIKVMKELPSRYHLFFLGEGPLREEIEKLVKETNLSERVHFLGFRKDVPTIVKACDIVVIPSKWEGFGLVAVEAMAAGKPVVCSDVPGVREVVGEAGLVIEADNVEAFKTAILSLVKSDVYQYYAQKSLKQSYRFDLHKMVGKYLELYVR